MCRQRLEKGIARLVSGGVEVQSAVGRENSVYEGLEAETNEKLSSVAKG